MNLYLRHNSNLHPPPAAAFIRGAAAMAWLKEIDRWGLPAAELECYFLPESVQSPAPAGLLVIFKDAGKIKDIVIAEPYTCIGGKLYIPVDAELLPQVSAAEWQDLLVWERQVFHPSIGFVGFEKADQVSLSDLFSYSETSDADWSFAHPGLPDRPRLEEIRVERPSAEELIETIKEEIGQKPLEDIPADPAEESSALSRLLDRLKMGLLKGGLFAAAGLNRLMPEGNPSAGRHDPSGKPGFLQQLQEWLAQNLGKLQEKRDNEIGRLLKLFDENRDEALQYAIPLDSQYLKRGNQTGSGHLMRRSTQFDLDRLGGGEAVDYWDIGHHYHSLRTKYLDAAQKEIERKNFKKSAYIYAHLLADFNSAANVLEQGGLYREAAALYQDHLKNIASAAECLERGGLYHEAIELYDDMGRHEKAGDLYMRLQLPEKGEQQYEKYIAERLSQSEHLDASRVMTEKLYQTARGKQTLLEGWKESRQSEACLKGYFDMVLKKEEENTEKEVREVFARHTTEHKRVSFLNVLEYVGKKKRDPELAATAQEIAYEIVHDETEAGRTAVLSTLKKFLPGDRLIGSDTSRYTTGMLSKATAQREPGIFHLDPSIRWLKAVWHRHQFLVVGIKNDCLHMARGNWYGNLEYYSWTNTVKPNIRVTLINTPYYSNTVLLHSSDGLPVTRKNLPRNKYFTEALLVYCPVWLHGSPAQCLIGEDKDFHRLALDNGALTLHHYSPNGELKRSVHCHGEEEERGWNHLPAHGYIAWHEGYYYTYSDKDFISISEAGQVSHHPLGTGIRFFAALQSFREFYIVISTNKGCLLCRTSHGKLLMGGDFFATDPIPSIIAPLSATLFVIAEKRKASLFGITNGYAVMISELEVRGNIIAVMPARNHNQFAVVEESGRISIHDTRQEVV
ncbi:MAG: hypothetical protein ABW019_07160 [Chitinophagaceae bacterium]